jgi:hypothetical protein
MKTTTNIYAVCPDRRALLDARTITAARQIVRNKYPDALRIERETVKKEISKKTYRV